MNDSAAGLPATRKQDDADLRELIAVYLDEWPLIAGVTVLALLLAGLYAIASTPVYRTNALIQVEEKGSSLGALGDLSAVLTGEMPTEAEIEIVRSRAVLGAAVQQRKLEIVAEPKYFPVIGGAFSRSYRGTAPAAPRFGLERFAWGGERIRVERLDVPPALTGEALTLIAGSGGAYTLYYGDEQLLQGRVGERQSDNGIEIFVSELVARAQTQFELQRLSWLDALEGLREKLRVTELGKQTGILEFSLEGEEPNAIAATLDAVAQTYLRQNVERTSEDAAQTLEFLELQLPQLKAQLDAAEASLNAYRIRQGTVDLSLETQGLLEQVGEIEKQISELELKHAELSQRFTTEHPVMQAIAQQRRELEELRAGMEAQIRELPVAEQDSVRLMRDVRVANELYMLLLNRAQELKVVRAGTVGNVRIIDSAFEPTEPVKPNKPLTMSFALIAGLLGGLFAVSAREALNPTIRDSEDLEKAAGLPVYAVVPHSEQEASLNAGTAKDTRAGHLLFKFKADDVAIESLRSLRTSLEFLLLDLDTGLLTVGGPAPGAGKSFVSANLAALFAHSGRRVVLLDADLRRGHLHRLFDLPRAPGLSDVIRGAAQLDDATHIGVSEGLDFIATGEIPPNPAEMLGSPRFESTLATLQERYEVVLADAPPVLGAAEAMTLARLSAINLLVVRSGQQTPREIELSVSKLRQSGASVNGFVLNDLPVNSRRHTYAGYHYYRYGRK